MKITLEHAAIWTNQLENLRMYYETYFDAHSNEKYLNQGKKFESYFLTFASGARLELMQRHDITDQRNNIDKQHLGLIHLAFEVDSVEDVNQKAIQLKQAGFEILQGPRITGDGYYEFETLDIDNNRLEVATIYKK